MASDMQVGLDEEKSYRQVIEARLCGARRHDLEALRKEGAQAVALLSGYFPEALEAHASVVDLWATLEAQEGHVNEGRTLAWEPFLARPDVLLRRDFQKKYAWWEVHWGRMEKLREFYGELMGRKKHVMPLEARVDAARAWVSAEERFGLIVHEMHARRLLSSLQAQVAAAADAQQKRPEQGTRKRARADDGRERRPPGAEAKKKQHRTDRAAAAEDSALAKDAKDSQDAKDAVDTEHASGTPRKGASTAHADAAGERIYTEKCTVFVKNLPLDVTEQELQELFEVHTPTCELQRAWLLGQQAKQSVTPGHACRVQRRCGCRGTMARSRAWHTWSFLLMPRWRRQ
jgi:predicted enzyme related to lactoylglutathione lyase